MHVAEIKCIMDMLNSYKRIHYHRGYNPRFGMLGAIYGSEITMILKILSFWSKYKDLS